MTNLTQQLEDKKKGCREHFIFINKYCGDKRPLGEDTDEPTWLCPHCKAEIAILEQAIAEMQKQRQDFIDIINSLGEIRGKSNDLQCIKLGESFSTNSVEWLKKELLKQLNKPKEERKE